MHMCYLCDSRFILIRAFILFRFRKLQNMSLFLQFKLPLYAIFVKRICIPHKKRLDCTYLLND